MTVRTFERKFVGEMGLSPKLFARLRRFQTALDRKRASGTRWLDVAHEFPAAGRYTVKAWLERPGEGAQVVAVGFEVGR